MGKTNVRVLVRTRPTDAFSPNIKILEDSKTVHLHTTRKAAAVSDVINNTNDDHMYKTDGVLRDVSQETVYEVAAADLVKSTMAGYNGTLMCYGQTGAGKTFTLMGGADYRTRGCVPRCIKAVFDEAQLQADKTFEISVSFLEIYNDRIRDLLNPLADEDYQVQEDAKGAIAVRGVEHRPCGKEADALALLFEGNTNRQTSEHTLNSNSSRSHVVFTMHIQSRSRVESESASIISKLHCIDLAGSERLSKTGSEGKTAKEAQYINKSLTFLEQVVMALGNANRSHVPFRQSKLTSILKDSLGGNSRTTMIANLWPEDRNFEETNSTLKFAVRMMRVQTDPTVNAIVDSATQIKLLQRTITELKAELQMQNQLAGKSHVQYEGDFGEDERFELEKTSKAYVSGGLQAIQVKSLREVKEYFRIFKAMIEQKDAELRSSGGGATSAGAANMGGSLGITAGAGVLAGAGSRTGTAPGVGLVDKSSGFSVGVAAPSKNLKEVMKAQPPTAGAPTAGGGRGESTANPNASVERSAYGRGGGDDYTNAADRSNASINGGAELPDKNTAFVDYKHGPGAKLARFIKESQEELGNKKKHIAEFGRTINQLKNEIDSATADLNRLRTERLSRGDDDVVDDHELQLVSTVKESKMQYRKLYDELTQAKDERDATTRSIDTAKRRLVEDFESWYQVQCDAIGGGGGSGHPSPSKQHHHGGRYAAAVLDDDLDEGERFEALEMNRVLDDDPESVAFYTAKKMAVTKQSASARSAAGGAGGAFSRNKGGR